MLAQYTKFLTSVKASLAAMEASGPLPPGVCLLRRFITVGVETTLPPEQTPGAWMLHRFVTRTC